VPDFVSPFASKANVSLCARLGSATCNSDPVSGIVGIWTWLTRSGRKWRVAHSSFRDLSREGGETMDQFILLRRYIPLCPAGALIIACLLCADLATAEPPPWVWSPGQPLPPGPFFRARAFPRPVPIPPYRIPLPPQVPSPYTLAPITPLPGMTGSTDRFLVVAPVQNDSRFVVTSWANIDPGIIHAPQVQGLPVRPARWRSGR
jgi:hypothetical protein